MPDMFGGDSAPAATTITDDSTSILEQFKLKAVEVTKSFLIDMWLARVTEDRVMPILHKVIDAAKEQYADAIKQGGGIYAVGYCVGARFVLLLAKKSQATGGDEESGAVKTGPFIKAGALAHAASVVPDDFENLSVPLSFVCVENDPLFPDSVRMGGEDRMSHANLKHEVIVYPGVPHGKRVITSGNGLPGEC
ncbi:Protein AIM2 [Ilyonectria robusta]